MFTKLVVSFAVAGLAVVSAAQHRVTLFEESVVNGTTLKPGEYKLGLQATDKQGRHSNSVGIEFDLRPAPRHDHVLRRRLLDALEQMPASHPLRGQTERAYRLLDSEAIRRALDISSESQAVRDRYGYCPEAVSVGEGGGLA